MFLKTLSDHSLLLEIKTLAAEERKLVTKVLELLLEVDARLLFAELGYSSLYDFCIHELGYSEGSAHLRVSSMRLLKSVSSEEKASIELKLESGELSLSNLSMVQNFTRREERLTGEKVSVEEKIELITEVENKSKREAERILAVRNPDAMLSMKDQVKPLSQEITQITFAVKNEFMEKLSRAKEIRGHAFAPHSHAALFEELLEFYLQQKDPVQKAERNRTKNKNRKKDADSSSENSSIPPQMPGSFKAPAETPPSPERLEVESKVAHSRSRFIEAKVRHAVWHRDGGRCTYIDLKNKRACNSSFGLEIDHIIPFAKGGSSQTVNLRLRCRAHNTLHAIKSYGRTFRRSA
jgi:hypothetical protein